MRKVWPAGKQPPQDVLSAVLSGSIRRDRCREQGAVSGNGEGKVTTERIMDAIADRRYPPPIYGADWTASAIDVASVALSIALSKHVPGWPGATDEEIEAVARSVIAALDAPQVERRSGDAVG